MQTIPSGKDNYEDLGDILEEIYYEAQEELRDPELKLKPDASEPDAAEPDAAEPDAAEPEKDGEASIRDVAAIPVHRQPEQEAPEAEGDDELRAVRAIGPRRNVTPVELKVRAPKAPGAVLNLCLLPVSVKRKFATPSFADARKRHKQGSQWWEFYFFNLHACQVAT